MHGANSFTVYNWILNNLFKYPVSNSSAILLDETSIKNTTYTLKLKNFCYPRWKHWMLIQIYIYIYIYLYIFLNHSGRQVSSSHLQKFASHVYLFNPNLLDAKQPDGSQRTGTKRNLSHESIIPPVHSSRLSLRIPPLSTRRPDSYKPASER